MALMRFRENLAISKDMEKAFSAIADKLEQNDTHDHGNIHMGKVMLKDGREGDMKLEIKISGGGTDAETGQ